MRGLGAEIGTADREAIIRQCNQSDQFLSVLYVPGFPVGRGSNRVLPLANDLDGLAVFENYANAYSGLTVSCTSMTIQLAALTIDEIGVTILKKSESLPTAPTHLE